MLSIPTLWTVFIVNFLALGLIWAYVLRSYPDFEAARFWTGSAFAGASGAMLVVLSFFVTSLLPFLAGGTVMIFATCLAMMGIRQFYGKPLSWRVTALITGASFTGLAFFIAVQRQHLDADAVYSLGQSLPLALTFKLLLAPHERQRNPGARLAGVVSVLIIAIYAIRALAALLHLGGSYSVTQANPAQWVLVLALMFLSMALNFGLVLMSMDRLRSEAANLALLDDLTGVANRRHLMQRLSEDCARSERTLEPFALLVIDIDGFKTINDKYGHAAGDACLQHFSLMAQTRLRPGDLLARAGGDEFCIVVASCTLSEAEIVARRPVGSVSAPMPSSAWTGISRLRFQSGLRNGHRRSAPFPDQLIAAADQALYTAKSNGKSRHAVYDPVPPLAPELDAVLEQALRKHA